MSVEVFPLWGLLIACDPAVGGGMGKLMLWAIFILLSVFLSFFTHGWCDLFGLQLLEEMYCNMQSTLLLSWMFSSFRTKCLVCLVRIKCPLLLTSEGFWSRSHTWYVTTVFLYRHTKAVFFAETQHYKIGFYENCFKKNILRNQTKVQLAKSYFGRAGQSCAATPCSPAPVSYTRGVLCAMCGGGGYSHYTGKRRLGHMYCPCFHVFQTAPKEGFTLAPNPQIWKGLTVEKGSGRTSWGAPEVFTRSFAYGPILQ